MPANARELLDEIEKGLEGVTPGPWDTTAALLVRAIDGEDAIPIFEARTPWKKHRRASTAVKQEWHNAHHIARCNPANLRTIIAYVKELEGALGSIIAKHDDWRKCMPADWEGDPLSSAIDRARQALAQPSTQENDNGPV